MSVLNQQYANSMQPVKLRVKAISGNGLRLRIALRGQGSGKPLSKVQGPTRSEVA